MALVSTFPSDQQDRAKIRKVDTGLNVTYSRRTIFGTWGWTNSLNVTGAYYSMMEYHRYARKRYRYVGMTSGAKDACISAMNSLYNRTCWTNYWQDNGSWGPTEVSGSVPLALVTPIENDDGSWDVEIDVNEDDVRYSHVHHTVSAKSKFSGYESNRDYDGETES